MTKREWGLLGCGVGMMLGAALSARAQSSINTRDNAIRAYSFNAIQIYPDGQVKFDWKAVEQCARDPQQLYCKVAWAAHKECR